MRSLPTLAALAAAALVAPAAADAATKPVYAGPPAGLAGSLPEGADANAFYPRTVKVNAGDKVAFKLRGFHNVVFPPKGGDAGPFIVPDPAQPVTGVKDSLGVDFWFNGQPNLFLNMAHVAPQGDGVVDGSELEGSGISQGPGAAPDYVASFPEKGTYKYLCTIHPGMKGKVRVVPANAKSPSRAKDARTVAKQFKKTVKLAKKLADEDVKGNVVRAGKDKKEVVTFGFFPATRSIEVGESVRFEISKDTTEIHNVVFGPEDVLAGLGGSFIQPGPAGIRLDPMSVYPSDLGALTYDGTNHGNGFLNTGILDGEQASPQPSAQEVTFTKAGSFGFICTVHPFMKGTIEVS